MKKVSLFSCRTFVCCRAQSDEANWISEFNGVGRRVGKVASSPNVLISLARAADNKETGHRNSSPTTSSGTACHRKPSRDQPVRRLPASPKTVDRTIRHNDDDDDDVVRNTPSRKRVVMIVIVFSRCTLRVANATFVFAGRRSHVDISASLRHYTQHDVLNNETTELAIRQVQDKGIKLIYL